MRRGWKKKKQLKRDGRGKLVARGDSISGDQSMDASETDSDVQVGDELSSA